MAHSAGDMWYFVAVVVAVCCLWVQASVAGGFSLLPFLKKSCGSIESIDIVIVVEERGEGEMGRDKEIKEVELKLRE